MAASAYDLPGWRRPMYGGCSSTDHGTAEPEGIRSALMYLLTEEPQTFEALAAGVREHWGSAKSSQIWVQLLALLHDKRVRREHGGFVCVDDDGDA